MTIKLLLTEFRKNTFFQFNVILKIILGVLLLQLFFIFLDIPVYVDLFVGPLLYLYTSKTNNIKISFFRVSFLHILLACFLFWLTMWNHSEFVLFFGCFVLDDVWFPDSIAIKAVLCRKKPFP
ncbi:hypothetical protein L1275_003309 [Flavobacterium sp. HSC-61S13]|nr:hypothetical protein [Flavobacterium sp. HSC-61S13]